MFNMISRKNQCQYSNQIAIKTSNANVILPISNSEDTQKSAHPDEEESNGRIPLVKIKFIYMDIYYLNIKHFPKMHVFK